MGCGPPVGLPRGPRMGSGTLLGARVADAARPRPGDPGPTRDHRPRQRPCRDRQLCRAHGGRHHPDHPGSSRRSAGSRPRRDPGRSSVRSSGSLPDRPARRPRPPGGGRPPADDAVGGDLGPDDAWSDERGPGGSARVAAARVLGNPPRSSSDLPARKPMGGVLPDPFCLRGAPWAVRRGRGKRVHRRSVRTQDRLALRGVCGRPGLYGDAGGVGRPVACATRVVHEAGALTGTACDR